MLSQLMCRAARAYPSNVQAMERMWYLYYRVHVTMQYVCCRYTTKHLNDETTPKTVKNLLAWCRLCD